MGIDGSCRRGEEGKGREGRNLSGGKKRSIAFPLPRREEREASPRHVTVMQVSVWCANACLKFEFKLSSESSRVSV